jgi:hypothetical protein
VGRDGATLGCSGFLPRDERGRRAKISAKTKTEVVAKQRQRLREREAGLSSAAGRMTVRQYLEGWVRDSLPVMNLADSSKAQPRVDGAIASGSGARSDQAAQAEPGACAAVHREELNAGKGPRTIKLAHNTLRTALKQAELWLVPRKRRVPGRLVTTPRYSPQERRPFTRGEQARILAAARDDPLHVLIVLAHACGLLQSELLGL